VNIVSGYTVSDTVVTDEICGDGQGAIDITVSGGTSPYTFAWSNGATTEDVTGLSAASYTCIITDNNGCDMTAVIDVLNQIAGISLDTTIITDETCGNGQGAIDITVNGGALPYAFAWSNGDTTEDITGLNAGSYTCIITDNDGCDFTTVIDVLNQTDTISLDTTIITDELCGNGQGAIDITVNGGTLPYTFAWSNGDTTENITGLNTGSYTCIITDNNGCNITTIAIDVLNQTGNFSLDTIILTEENCGDGQGAIDITLSGGVSPYTFAWSTGDTLEDISGLNAGNYTCQITDSNGCIINLSADVTNATGSLNLDSSIVTDEICGNGQGAVDISVSGGTTPYTFAWSNGATTEDINGLSAGNYTCQITDSNGCFINLLADILNAAGTLIPDSSIVTDENCGNGQGAIDITVSGGMSPYTFAWSNGASTEDISGLSAGNYTCIITDNNGCVINISENVLNQTGSFSLDTIIVTYEICGNGQGIIDITVSGGSSPYIWSNGAVTEDINGLSAGNYSVVITDNSGCIINQAVDVLNATGTFSLDNISTCI